MRFTHTNQPPLNLPRLAALEQKWKYVLPNDYRSFLIRFNGGSPESNLLRLPGCGVEVLVDCFFGIAKPHLDIEDWLDELDDDLGDAFLPIGFDPGGNVFLLEKLSGSIYYWDSARHFSFSSDSENTFLAASSFENLIESLQCAQIEAQSNKP